MSLQTGRNSFSLLNEKCQNRFGFPPSFEILRKSGPKLQMVNLGIYIKGKARGKCNSRVQIFAIMHPQNFHSAYGIKY